MKRDYLKVKIKTLLKGYDCYGSSSGKIYVKGNIFLDKKALSLKEIYEGLENEKQVFLEKINGFYSLVYVCPLMVIAAVDIIRSIPLFYSYNEIDNEIVISENTHSLLLGKKKNLVNIDIFQLCSYVIGNETLYDDIKQIQAGEFLLAHNSFVEEKKYFEFNAEEPLIFDKTGFLYELNIVLKKSFQRMLNFTKNKQIIVPLSGGYDSRLIVSMLKELNCENVVCYSYGVKGNKEAEYSKNIAGSLGYKWIFLEYTEDKWKQAWNSELAHHYINHAGNHTSLPHIQDWLAVKEIKDKKLVDNDAIFIPGHCCVTGYINREILNYEGNYKKFFFNSVIDRHFNLCPIKELKVIRNKSELIDVLKLKLQVESNFNSNIVSNIMIYNWKERQSKYIANSVRVYEQFGYSWWLPLWDRDFVEMWINFPNKLRVDRIFFKEFVSEKYSKVSGVTVDLGNAKRSTPIYRLISFILDKTPYNLRLYVKSLYRKSEYKNHDLLFGAIVDHKLRDSLTKKGYKISGIYAYCVLKNVWVKYE